MRGYQLNCLNGTVHDATGTFVARDPRVCSVPKTMRKGTNMEDDILTPVRCISRKNVVLFSREIEIQSGLP